MKMVAELPYYFPFFLKTTDLENESKSSKAGLHTSDSKQHLAVGLEFWPISIILTLKEK